MKTETELKDPAAPASTDGPKTEAPAKPQYDKNELLAIFDEMIFSGEYKEPISLRGGKLKIVFRSRSVSDTTAISRDIDAKSFTLITTLQEYRALQNLAYSLVSYAGNDWSKLSVEDRVKKLNEMPGPVASLLSMELTKFDQKIFAACEEGEANF